LAWAALSALFFTVEVISSIEADVSSRLDACFSVRWLKFALPREISSAPARTSAAARFMVRITSAILLSSALTLADRASI
jgi:hypothetical protein